MDLLLIIIIVALPALAHIYILYIYDEHSKINNSSNLTGAQIARTILDNNTLVYHMSSFNLLIMHINNRIKEITTKSNSKMAFITGSDEISTIDLTMFPKILEEYPNIKEGDILLIKGKVEKRYDKYQIIINKIKELQ